MSICKICNVETPGNYEYCYVHYQENSAKNKAVPAGQWHADPVVDQLMKINANLGKIAIALGNQPSVSKGTGFLDELK